MKLQPYANELAETIVAGAWKNSNDALVDDATDTSSFSRRAPWLGIHSRVAALTICRYELEYPGFARPLMGEQYLNRAREPNRKRRQTLLE